MRFQGPTSLLIRGPAEQWPSLPPIAGVDDSVSIGDMTGLTLDARVDGPLGLGSQDGSLGRVILPLGMAVDEDGILYLLSRKNPEFRRFDPETCEFVPLTGSAGQGTDVGQFKDPSNIAVVGDNLYVVDRGNRRVQVLSLKTVSVRHVWGPLDSQGHATKVTANDEEGCAAPPTTFASPSIWEPVDVTAYAGRAYILDRRYGSVYVHSPGTDALQPLIKEPTADSWTRIAVDRTGGIYLYSSSPGAPRVTIYNQKGRRLGTAKDAEEIRDRFDPPAVHFERAGQNGPWIFRLPQKLKLLCDECETERRRLAFAQPCTDRQAAPTEIKVCAPSENDLLFDSEGNHWRGNQQPHVGEKCFVEEGTWISRALDSEVYRCQWHRIELDLYQLPPGTRVEVYTYSAADNDLTPAEVRQRLENFGKLSYSVAGKIERLQKTEIPAETLFEPSNKNPNEFLIQSREGQYLWLKIVLHGDGYDSPAVRSLRIHYPRESYLEYLPAIFSSDDEMRWFLERFLSIFKTEWDSLEDRIADVPALFVPKSVPPGRALEFLASWFALPLEGEWKDEQKRRLLEAVPEIYFGNWRATKEGRCLTEVDSPQPGRRGTSEGLRRYLQVYVQNMTGLTVEEQGNFPRIDEGFRERRRLMLTLNDTANLSHGAPLWSASTVGRLHLGVYAREGEARLVSTGDPEHEIFQEFAHRFRVFVPSSWIETNKDEAMLHRALREEKPAHTTYDLCLVEPRFRVGLQSTVGVDTIIGGWPAARLACIHDTDVPASRPPRHCLGFDTILAAQPGPPPTLQVVRSRRAGIDTVLN